MKILLAVPVILLLFVGTIASSQAMTEETMKDRLDKIKKERAEQIKNFKVKQLDQEEKSIKSEKTKIRKSNVTAPTNDDIADNNRNAMTKATLDTQEKIRKMKGLDESDKLKNENAILNAKLNALEKAYDLKIDALEKKIAKLQALIDILNSTKISK